MQKDLNAYLETYNRQRPHRLQGRDPEEVPGPEEAGWKGGHDRSVDLTSVRPRVSGYRRTCFSLPLNLTSHQHG